MKLFRIIILALCLLPAWALGDSFVVSDIRVEGLQRVSAGSVFSEFPISINERVDERKLAQAAKTLFRSGLFDDIALGRDGNVLVITVEERPSISNIELEGNEQIPDEDLMSGLKQAGLAEGQVFQRATLEQIEQELQRMYSAQGRYGARIITEVNEQPRNRVDLKVTVREGEVATIKHINIVGNQQYDDATLLDLFELQTPSFWTFFSGADKYARERLSGDLERLRSWYLDRGFINFNVESTQVSISPDKEDVFLTVNVSEGERYRVREVKLSGELIVPEEEIRELLQIESGDIFSRQTLTETSSKITRRLGDEGYTFANVNGIPEIHEDDNTVSITFFVDPGRRAYVRRINFRGNTTTMDEVLRQEMRQMEGGWASTEKIQQSKVRLERLGFFKSVNVETRPVPGASDLVDVNYEVEEQPTGSVSASVGFSQSSGVILGASLSQKNFLGTGKRVSVGVNRSEFRTNYNFSFFNPYYTVDGVSRGFNLFFRQTDFGEGDISNFTTDAYGGSISFGYPIGPTDRLSFSVGADNTTIKKGEDAAQEIENFLAEEGTDNMAYRLTASWKQNRLNRGVLATDGSSQSVSLETAVPGSDLNYYKLTYKGQIFQPLAEEWSLRFRTELGYGDGYGDTSQLPFYEHFFSGGFSSVRGYRGNTLGPKSTPSSPEDEPDPFGGNILVEGGIELIFPMPFVEDRRSVQSSLFVDAGNVFTTNCLAGAPDCTEDVQLGELRYSVGVGLTWLTAIGPLTFSLAQPFNDETGDETEVFQFALGQTF